jgi:UDP-N-acetylmuramoylalanine--D-glutamate ligase
MSLRPPEFLQSALSKPVAILGGGVSGEGVHALLAAVGARGMTYDADRAKGADFTAEEARRHALVIFSPGFAPDHVWLERARAAGAECLGELDFASLFWHGRVVAITGTNGKTTLTEFLVHALGGIGRDAHATGNIGHPFSRLVAEKKGGARDSFAICEVSSFQAETLRHLRPEATLWTNFAEDHLERHATLGNYFNAKWTLVERTRSGAGEVPRAEAAPLVQPCRHVAFVGASVERFARRFERPPGPLLVVATENQPPDPRLAGTVFANPPQRENFQMAAAWWRASGFDEAALFAAARTFAPARHRLARVAEHGGVTFWNDSKATNFHAVEAALAGFAAPVVLIAGGRAKGGDLGGFVRRIAPGVKHAVLIGETAEELALLCASVHLAHSRCPTLAHAVRRATQVAAAGEHVLLSPGFASFDMFRNYEDRGDQFESLVRTAVRTGAVPAANLG